MSTVAKILTFVVTLFALITITSRFGWLASYEVLTLAIIAAVFTWLVARLRDREAG